MAKAKNNYCPYCSKFVSGIKGQARTVCEICGYMVQKRKKNVYETSKNTKDNETTIQHG